MTDLERIKHIEKTLSIKLNQVSVENLFTENCFLEKSDLWWISRLDPMVPKSFYKGVRNYSIDRNGNITGLALDFTNLLLLEVDFLRGFAHLQKLKLRSSKLFEYKFIGKFTKLSSLDLSGNDLFSADFLEDLKYLSSLNLSNNNLSNVEFLKDLKYLFSLNLSGNKLLSADLLKDLKNLSSLDLSYNSLSNYEFLSELKNLSSLDLSYNNLTNVDFLSELKNLSSLNLRNNKLLTADSLKNLKNLSSLNLSSNNLSNYDSLKDFKELYSLNLRGNKLSSAKFLRELKNLSSLDLSNNNLTNVDFLSELKNLSSLNLRNNNLTNVDFLKDLNNLTSFQIYGNFNLEIPKNLKKMIEYRGQISSLSKYEINQIVNYYKQLEEKQGLIFEAKVLIVGEPEAGKTTLTKKIMDNEKWVKEMKGKKSVQTVGIEINKIQIPYHKDKSKQITAHFWDFGGQDIQYVLHQYFFTERSLYVLLGDGREEFPNFNYWFEIITTLGRDCPVLVVLNENGGKPVKTFKINEFRDQFGKYLECIEEESVNFYEDDDGRFETLKNKIHLKTSNLKQIGSALPKKWIDVRKEIEKIKEPYVSKDEFLKICERFKLTNKDYQEQLRDYLHDLGIALNYKTDTNLRNKFILKPNWVIDSLYVVLQDNKIEKERGRFKVDYVEELWQKEGYSLTDCDLLLGLMQKGRFEIAYKINNNEFIVPILLPHKPEKNYRLEEINEIRTEFQFKFMPKGIVPRLIVRLHKNIFSMDGEQIVWNQGVLLSHHDSIAEVVEHDQSKQITIKVIGENVFHNKELLTIIRNEIHGINRDWFEKRLKFDELVPCICDKCKQLEKKIVSTKEDELNNLSDDERKSMQMEEYKLFELQDRLRNNVYKIQCSKSYEDIPIQDLLKDIYVITENMENKESKIINISGINGNVIFDSNIKDSTIKNLVKQSDNFEEINKKLDEIFEKLSQQQSDELTELTDALIQVIDEKLVKENKLSAEQVEAVNKAKYSSDTKFKLKVGLPLASLTGIDASVEHEFKMSKEIKADGVIRFLRKILGHDNLQTISPKQLED